MLASGTENTFWLVVQTSMDVPWTCAFGFLSVDILSVAHYQRFFDYWIPEPELNAIRQTSSDVTVCRTQLLDSHLAL
jgi:hypothetical protein